MPKHLIETNLKHRAEAGLAADALPRRKHDRELVHGARAPPHLLSKHDVTAIAGVSYVTIWSWMRAGIFPRSRVVGGRSMWLSSEVEAWMASLPLRPLKGDDKSPEAV